MTRNLNPKPNHKTHSSKSPVRKPLDGAIHRVMQLVAERQYQKVLDLIGPEERDAHLRNARGVCLMRSGRVREATQLFRELVLPPGCTWVRRDNPDVYTINYATALLMGGHTAGCLEILSETVDRSLPGVQRLRAAIARWQSTLSFWQRLNWRFGGIAPANCFVPIDFEPGEFDWQVTRPNAPPSQHKSTGLRTAI